MKIASKSELGVLKRFQPNSIKYLKQINIKMLHDCNLQIALLLFSYLSYSALSWKTFNLKENCFEVMGQQWAQMQLTCMQSLLWDFKKTKRNLDLTLIISLVDNCLINSEKNPRNTWKYLQWSLISYTVQYNSHDLGVHDSH